MLSSISPHGDPLVSSTLFVPVVVPGTGWLASLFRDTFFLLASRNVIRDATIFPIFRSKLKRRSLGTKWSVVTNRRGTL